MDDTDLTGRARIGAQWPGWWHVGVSLAAMPASLALTRLWSWFNVLLLIALIRPVIDLLAEGAKALGLVVLDYDATRFRVRLLHGPAFAMIELAELTGVTVGPRFVEIRGLYLRGLRLPRGRTAEQERWGAILLRAARARGIHLGETDQQQLTGDGA
jgi:hypothetical protein